VPTYPALAASFEELLLELHAGAYARRTVLALVDGETLYLPIEETLDLLEVAYQGVDDSLVVATLQPSGTMLRIHAWSGRARRGEVSLIGRTVLRDWVPYVDQTLLSQWLDVGVSFDSGELIARLDPVDKLPIGQRLLRERLRIMSFNPRRAEAADLRILPRDRFLQGFVLDWNARLPGAISADEGSYQIGAGSALSGGGLDMAWREDLATNKRAFEGAWQRVWTDERWLKQLSLGRTRSSSPRAVGIRGVALGNSPFQRSIEFGAQIIRGILPPHWEVELYRYGQLIAYDTVDDGGIYEFEIPTDYGQNAIEIRAYGPHGETRILERAARVDFDRLPDGEFEYNASGGVCPTDDCESAWNLDLRHGFHPRWTLRMGIDYYTRAEDEPLSHPYAAISGSPWESWQIRVASAYEAQHELRVGFEPSLRWRSDIGFTRYDDTIEAPVWQPRSLRSRLEWSMLARPLQEWRSLFLNGNLQRSDGEYGEFWRSEIGLRQNVAGVRLAMRWREDWQANAFWPSRQSQLRGGLATLLRSRALGPLDRLFVRSEFVADIGLTGRHETALSLARALGHGSRLEIGGRWLAAEDDVLWTMAVSSTGSFAQWSSYATHSENARGIQSAAEGSVLYNESSERFEALPLRSRGRGGLQGTVFEDRNGNGLQDPPEPGVPDARIIVGHSVARTDQHGRYSIWDLLPYVETTLAIDALSLRNPLWVAPFELAATQVIPNGFASVDIPLLRAHELSAHLWVMDGNQRRPLGNARVVLRGAERGRVYEARSFSDGEVYLSGIVPDVYTIDVDPILLRRAGLRTADGELRVNLAADDASLVATEFSIELKPAE
jgi:hypothetical protein